MELIVLLLIICFIAHSVIVFNAASNLKASTPPKHDPTRFRSFAEQVAIKMAYWERELKLSDDVDRKSHCLTQFYKTQTLFVSLIGDYIPDEEMPYTSDLSDDQLTDEISGEKIGEVIDFATEKALRHDQ